MLSLQYGAPEYVQYVSPTQPLDGQENETHCESSGNEQSRAPFAGQAGGHVKHPSQTGFGQPLHVPLPAYVVGQSSAFDGTPSPSGSPAGSR
ncbi:TPA: hypothetical protein HA251_05590 [Candidatus Woesearchaeota archaeon]|nr:hypothetical protein [Candidatus Woesearchaeota archaeon]